MSNSSRNLSNHACLCKINRQMLEKQKSCVFAPFVRQDLHLDWRGLLGISFPFLIWFAFCVWMVNFFRLPQDFQMSSETDHEAKRFNMCILRREIRKFVFIVVCFSYSLLSLYQSRQWLGCRILNFMQLCRSCLLKTFPFPLHPSLSNW